MKSRFRAPGQTHIPMPDYKSMLGEAVKKKEAIERARVAAEEIIQISDQRIRILKQMLEEESLRPPQQAAADTEGIPAIG